MVYTIGLLLNSVLVHTLYLVFILYRYRHYACVYNGLLMFSTGLVAAVVTSCALIPIALFAYSLRHVGCCNNDKLMTLL